MFPHFTVRDEMAMKTEYEKEQFEEAHKILCENSKFIHCFKNELIPSLITYNANVEGESRNGKLKIFESNKVKEILHKSSIHVKFNNL